jgi:hypothetical protein
VFFNTTQHVIQNAVVSILLTPIAGLLGAVLLNWSRLLLDEERIDYWLAYKVTTLASMAVVVFLVPAQLISRRLGGAGIVLDLVLSVALLGLLYARWIRDDDEAIGLERGMWLSAVQSGLCLLVVGVFYGLSVALGSKTLGLGLALAISCTALLVMAATISLNRHHASQAQPRPIAWTTEDIVELHRHAAEELETGERDEDLWALATIARTELGQQRQWYLAERVKKLRDVAEEQLRREGLI